MSGQIIFIIWRESIEALLIIGILSSWLARNRAAGRAAAYLWGGVAAGVATALLFALLILGFAQAFTGSGRDYLMMAMLLIAAVLIVQMVAWMRRHGRTLKRDLEEGLSVAVQRNQWWTVFFLAAIAVAREGSETVVFLYGIMAGSSGGQVVSAVLAAGVGLVAALGTFALLQLGSRFLPWRGFFKVSEVVLLLLGCALFTDGVGRMVSVGWLPYGLPLWDTSWLLDDGARFGGVISALTGYRALPDMVTLGSWLVYWGSVTGLLRLQDWRAARADASHG